ncbi:MAG TPA: hypothetical protein VF572_05670 [Candidatus Saccharimonadales bacterium]|jgi:hypothetical protein
MSEIAAGHDDAQEHDGQDQEEQLIFRGINLGWIAASVSVEQAMQLEDQRLGQTGSGKRPEVAERRLNELRNRIHTELHGDEVPGSIDPVDALKEYDDIISFGKGRYSNAANNKVALRNAVMYPEQFATGPAYREQRERLACQLIALGIFNAHGADVILAINPNRPEGHVSGPGEAGQHENFAVVWQAEEPAEAA